MKIIINGQYIDLSNIRHIFYKDVNGQLTFKSKDEEVVIYASKKEHDNLLDVLSRTYDTVLIRKD